MVGSENRRNLGYILFFVARGPFLTTIIVVLLPLILDLLKFNVNSDGLIGFYFFGVYPSSIVVSVNSISSLLVVVLSPILGTISDYGDNRRRLIKGFFLAFLSALCLCPLLKFRSMWWLAVLIHLGTLTLFEICYVLFTAYLSEISTSKKQRSFLSSFSLIGENISVVVFLLLLPIVLRSESPRNLITKKHVQLKDDFTPWAIRFADSDEFCVQDWNKFNSLVKAQDKTHCIEYFNSYKSDKPDLEIFVPKNQTVSFMQTRPVEKKLVGEFQFSSFVSTKEVEGLAHVQFFVTKRNALNKSDYRVVHGKKTQVSSERKYIRLKFNLEENTSHLTFEARFSSGPASILAMENVETVLSINHLYLKIIVFSGVFFCFTAFVALLLVGRRNHLNAETLDLPSKEIVLAGIELMCTSLKNCYLRKDYFIFIMGNTFWRLGFTIFQTLILIFLEDNLAFSSSQLAQTFLLICLSGIAGAWISYNLENRIGQYDTCLIFLGIWVFNPLFLYYFDPLSTMWLIILPLHVGVSIGGMVSVKYAIFTNIIPENREGEYMGVIFFSTKLMEFVGNFAVSILINFISSTKIIALGSLVYLTAFFVFLPFMLEGKRQDERALINEQVNDITDELIEKQSV